MKIVFVPLVNSLSLCRAFLFSLLWAMRPSLFIKFSSMLLSVECSVDLVPLLIIHRSPMLYKINIKNIKRGSLLWNNFHRFRPWCPCYGKPLLKKVSLCLTIKEVPMHGMWTWAKNISCFTNYDQLTTDTPYFHSLNLLVSAQNKSLPPP